MTAAHYKGGHHPGNDLGLHHTALPPIVASCPYSDQLLVTRKFWSPGANRPSQVRVGAFDDGAVNTQRPGDVFEALLAEIGKLGLDLAAHLPKSVIGNADAA